MAIKASATLFLCDSIVDKVNSAQVIQFLLRHGIKVENWHEVETEAPDHWTSGNDLSEDEVARILRAQNPIVVDSLAFPSSKVEELAEQGAILLLSYVEEDPEEGEPEGLLTSYADCNDAAGTLNASDVIDKWLNGLEA